MRTGEKLQRASRFDPLSSERWAPHATANWFARPRLLSRVRPLGTGPCPGSIACVPTTPGMAASLRKKELVAAGWCLRWAARLPVLAMI